MNKLFACMAMILMVSTGLSAVDLGLGVINDFALAKEADLPEEYDNLFENAFLTFHIDVPLDRNIGLLMNAGVRFDDLGEEDSPAFVETIHWNAQFGPVYHLFTYKKFLDPYGSIGVGCAGSVHIDENEMDNFGMDEDAYWRANVSLELYAYASAGLNLVLSHRLVIGAEVQTKIYSFNPTSLETYSFYDYSLRISCGVRL
ncbi:MAG: hypothetical protein JW874_01345 [Spirochaetales bacterium]|nr:hypothetical protein [Spirochaetales bacterium]